MKEPFISPAYRGAVYEAIALQILIIFLSSMILDGGGILQICLIAVPAFWGGATLLIFRNRHAPSKADIQLIRFGYFPVVAIAFFLVHWVWQIRGLS